VIASADPRGWLPGEVALVEAVGKQLGAAADRLRLFHDAQERAWRMARLVALSETLNRPLRIADVVAAIGRAAHNLSGADRAAVFLHDPDGTVGCDWSQGLAPEYIRRLLAHKDQLPLGGLFREEARRDRLTLPGGFVLERGEPFLCPDVQVYPKETPLARLLEGEGVRAISLWPMTYEGHVTGVIACYYDAPHRWSEPEREVFLAFSWQAAAELANARLLEAQLQRTKELETFYELSRRLRGAPTVGEMYPILVEQAMGLLHADHGALSLLDPGHETFTRAYTVGVPTERPGQRFPVAGSRSGGAVLTGVTYVTQDFAEEPQPPWLVAASYQSIGPMVIVPLRSEQEIVGSLALGRSRLHDAHPFSDAEVRLLEGIADVGGTAIRRARLHQNLQQAYVQMVLALAQAIESRDSYTAGHSERMVTMAERIARDLGCSEEEVQDVRWGARLHDIGKIGVPDAVLRKPSALSDQEWTVMRQHPVLGEEILRSVERMRGVAKLVRYHQEKWDGTGYPEGLKGEAIPLGSRILAVVDAYGAITETRPYKPARTHAEAVAEIRRCAGSQFDPRVVEVFSKVVEVG